MTKKNWNLQLEDLIKATHGEVVSKNIFEFSGITTDTRKQNSGKLFFALKGESFDAHDFLDKAEQSGCAGLVVHSIPQNIPANMTVIKVKDTLRALQELSTYWRHKMSATVLGITGTNGKTTTKDFATTLISSKFKTLSTAGNLNNFIGLPLSLLSLDESIEVGVFEMGLSVPGEMELLAKIADADVVAVTSIGRGHLEGMSSVQNIADNKEHLYLHSRADAVRIFNLDNAYTAKMLSRAPKNSGVLTFSSQNPDATVHFKEVVSTIDFLEIRGTIDGDPGSARIPIFGRHNLSNLMCAAALALAAGVEADHIWKALPRCKGYWGRNQIVKLKSGATVLFDAYNANPESSTALMQNVSRLKLDGHLFGIFGDMLELGAESSSLHKEWGELASKLPFEHLWYVGTEGEAFKAGAELGGFKKNLTITKSYQESLALKVLAMLNPGDIILVKGSRGMKLERVVDLLEPLDFKASK